MNGILLKSNDFINAGNNVPQHHVLLNWFKRFVLNSYIDRIFIGWRNVINGEKEGDFIGFLNYLTSFIPVYSRKIFQHSLTCIWLKNTRHIIVEYGGYNEKNYNAPYNTDIYYWYKGEYGLRMYEDPKNKFFEDTNFIEIQFNDKGLTCYKLIDILCYKNDYRQKDYKLLDLNCQRFCQNLIYEVSGKRFPGKDYRGNHTLTFANIPAYIAVALEDNEKDSDNDIGYIPILGDIIDKVRAFK